jgi:hypothetical protein
MPLALQLVIASCIVFKDMFTVKFRGFLKQKYIILTIQGTDNYLSCDMLFSQTTQLSNGKCKASLNTNFLKSKYKVTRIILPLQSMSVI